ncbi:Uncharacterised protein [Candidatus Anstonella stagnisolia]|nr:Uncharacterised protein [Candidatus Anstonella stagnisolia]
MLIMKHQLRCVTRQLHSRKGNKGTHKRMKSREGKINRKSVELKREKQDEMHPKYRWEKELLVEKAEKGSRG